MKKNKKIIVTFGTFDLFHFGHKRLIKKLSKKGELIVGVNSDESLKIKKPDIVDNENKRLKNVKSINEKAFIIDRYAEERIKFLKQLEGDVEFWIGSDHIGNPRVKKVADDSNVKLMFVKRTPFISSSKLRKKIVK